MRFPTALFAVTALAATACDIDLGGDEESSAKGDQQILAIGDSFLDWHGPDADLQYVAAGSLEMTIESAAVGGTTMLGGEGPDIPNQYVEGSFDLLIATGGGNDFGTCTCGEDCEDVLEALISEDGTEGIPNLVSRAIEGGAKVAWVGYFRPMDNDNEFSGCTRSSTSTVRDSPGSTAPKTTWCSSTVWSTARWRPSCTKTTASTRRTRLCHDRFGGGRHRGRKFGF